MNSITLTGNLTQKPVTIRSASGKIYAKFSIAVPKEKRGADGESSADFFKIAAFGIHAEFLAKYADKGDKILVRGRMDLGLFKSEDGTTVFNPTVEVGQGGEVEIEHKVDRDNAARQKTNNNIPF